MTDNETISENASDQIMPPPFYQSELRTGIVLGVISSIAYSAANLALREVAIPGDLDWAIWVTALKAVPAAIVAWLLIGIRVWKKLPALPPRALVVKLILAALLMQYGGNLCFQWSLTLGGLAVSVPLCFAVLIVTGAWLGRIFLGDVLSVRTRWAIGILGVSIFFLTAGAQAATASIHGQATSLIILAAVAAAGFSGFAYGVCGVIIRSLTQNLSLSASLVIFSTVGVVTLVSHTLLTADHQRILDGTRIYWQPLLASGVLNAIAFFAVAGALKRVPVTFVNLLNTTQNAMCALAGVLMFKEPLTIPLVIGCVLTLIGLMLVDSGKNPVSEPSCAEVNQTDAGD
ncbi:MAG: DMT family transporter [Planctomycetaceae bacterium]